MSQPRDREDPLWNLARNRMGRRRFLGLMAAGGAAAVLPGAQPQYSWARFEFPWNAEPGQHVIVTRATDAANNTQPHSVPFNEQGYLFNQPLPHPIRVT